MKTKILLLVLTLFSIFSYGQFDGFKNFTQASSVRIGIPVELTDESGNSLNIKSAYRIHLVTTGTSTKNGAEYLAWAEGAVWKIRAVNLVGSVSNHPLLIIENNIIKIATNHSSGYALRAFVEELNTDHENVRPNIFGASFQWQRKGNDLLYNDGNVSIGTDVNPYHKLNVNGNMKIENENSIHTSLRIGKDANDALITDHSINKNYGGGYFFRVTPDSTFTSSSYMDVMMISDKGRVGIGNKNPLYKLDVIGNANLDFGNSDLLFYEDSDVGNWSLLRSNKGNGIGIIGEPDRVAISVSRTTSNVGIGTTDTKNFKLGVNGRIAATEVKVATYENWSDFVFEKNYDLPSLKEVENQIKQNGHLSDIPSAKEVKENGFFLGAMDAKLLQKIEELTLYTIAQEKKLNTQKSKIEKLEEENTVLKSLLERVAKLEEQIKQ